MRVNAPTSFRGRLFLLVVLATSTAVAVAGGVAWTLEALRMKTTAVSESSASASVIATHSAAALAFDDHDAGRETLAALSALPNVIHARILDDDDSMFSEFERSEGASSAEMSGLTEGHHFEKNRLTLAKPIIHEGVRYGTLMITYDLGPYRLRLIKQALITVGIGACAVLVAMLLAARLLRALAGPVSELIHASQRISQSKDYSTRVARLNDDELGQLTDAFNDMIAQVEKRDEDLLAAQRAMKESNDQLQQFAYVASHDLQEPLRKIQAFSSMLLADHVDKLDDDGRLYIGRMDAAAARMSQLIADLLAFSRVSSKERNISAVDLNAVIRDVLSDLELCLKETGGQIDVAQLPTVHADEVHMRQMLLNLISNALKFHRADAPPVVTITAESVASARRGMLEWELRVKDNGIGFAQKYTDRIFAPFQRLHGRSEYEGTGIGLAVVKRIIERQQWEITAHSEPGAGAEFIVRMWTADTQARPADGRHRAAA